jgi:biopolymer transport protein ExbB
MASAAGNWWNDDWQYRKALTVKLPAMPAVAAAPSSVVLPIRLHAGNFSYFQDLQSGGADLRFVAGDGTPLKYQIEMLDPAAGLLVAWIEVPIKAGVTEQPIWMYYGNSRATKPEEGGLYDADQVLVLHFGESQGAPRDATLNRYDATASNVQLGMPGLIGNGARLDGHGVIRIAARPGLALAGGGFSFAAWLRPDNDSPRAVLYSQTQGDRHLEIGLSGLKLYAEVANGSHTSRVESTAPLALGQWQHVAVSLGSDLALYIDGAPAGTAASGSLPSINGDVLIGALDEAAGSGAFTGQMDEVELSKIPRSAWWARVTALGQSPETTVVEYGKDESKGTAGKFAAYIAMMSNLLSQVSLDGLVVITITAFMGLASLQVMFSKAALLKRIERQDAEFMPTFRERLPRDVKATVAGLKVVGAGGYDQSGLYALYRAGLAALESVAAVSAGSGLKMSSEAFEAIRAALDGALVEASNRMNARLVIMTIAIAGAPFLGLLGTVVGVMITFAAIAAAGDVNVNTIAPGVAAAMTATVVGLLVAIPSLFGYNWLATRIARRTSAMEVFADEWVSGVALLALAAREAHGQASAGTVERPIHAA